MMMMNMIIASSVNSDGWLAQVDFWTWHIIFACCRNQRQVLIWKLQQYFTYTAFHLSWFETADLITHTFSSGTYRVATVMICKQRLVATEHMLLPEIQITMPCSRQTKIWSTKKKRPKPQVIINSCSAPVYCYEAATRPAYHNSPPLFAAEGTTTALWSCTVFLVELLDSCLRCISNSFEEQQATTCTRNTQQPHQHLSSNPFSSESQTAALLWYWFCWEDSSPR